MNDYIDPYSAAVSALGGAVDAVLGEVPVRLSPAELADVVGRIELVARKLAAVQIAVAAAANQRDRRGGHRAAAGGARSRLREVGETRDQQPG